MSRLPAAALLFLSLCGIVLLIATSAGAATIVDSGPFATQLQGDLNAEQTPVLPGNLYITEVSGAAACGTQGDAGCFRGLTFSDVQGSDVSGGMIDLDIGDPENMAGWLAHEEGHYMDLLELTATDQNTIMQILGVEPLLEAEGLNGTYGWYGYWWRDFPQPDYPDQTASAKEWFAEAFRLCATWGVDMPDWAAAHDSTGYDYPGLSDPAMQRQMCAEIDAIGAANSQAIPSQATYSAYDPSTTSSAPAPTAATTSPQPSRPVSLRPRKRIARHPGVRHRNHKRCQVRLWTGTCL